MDRSVESPGLESARRVLSPQPPNLRISPDGPAHDGPALEEEPVTELLKELVAETGQLVRSEIQVARLEIQESARAVLRDAAMVAIFAGAALMGVFCLMAFMVIGLGELLSLATHDVNAYWISALIIGVLFITVGGGLAFRSIRKIGKDVRMRETQAELERDRQLIQRERRAFTEAVRP
jgi:uncharacterized membrane protein YqjE